MLADEASGAHIEDLDGRAAFVFDDGDDVPVFAVFAEDFLAFSGGFDVGDEVAEGGGAFKIEFFGGGGHVFLEFLDDAGVFALEKFDYLVKNALVFGTVGESGAGSEALLHVIVEARALFVSARPGFTAGDEGKDFVKER